MNYKEKEMLDNELMKKAKVWEKTSQFEGYYGDDNTGIFITSDRTTMEIYTYFNELPVSAIDEINEVTRKINWEIDKIAADGDGLLFFVFRKVK